MTTSDRFAIFELVARAAPSAALSHAGYKNQLNLAELISIFSILKGRSGSASTNPMYCARCRKGGGIHANNIYPADFH